MSPCSLQSQSQKPGHGTHPSKRLSVCEWTGRTGVCGILCSPEKEGESALCAHMPGDSSLLTSGTCVSPVWTRNAASHTGLCTLTRVCCVCPKHTPRRQVCGYRAVTPFPCHVEGHDKPVSLLRIAGPPDALGRGASRSCVLRVRPRVMCVHARGAGGTLTSPSCLAPPLCSRLEHGALVALMTEHVLCQAAAGVNGRAWVGSCELKRLRSPGLP